MSENQDDLIGFAVDEFRLAEELAASPPGGPAAVRAIVRRRRRMRLTTLSVLGALVIAVPIGAFAANPWGNNGPPTSREAAGALGCDVIHSQQANLDADPGLELAATMSCLPSRILAVDRDLFGRIVTSSVEVDAHVGGFRRPETGEGVGAVVVYDIVGNDLGAPPPQERFYGWDGAKFAQVGGPTAFVRAIADLTITSTPLHLGSGDQNRSGEITVTVTNRGPHAVESFRLGSATPYWIRLHGEVRSDEAIKPGETRTMMVTVRVEVGRNTVPLLFHIGVYAFIDDPHPEDNTAPLEVTL